MFSAKANCETGSKNKIKKIGFSMPFLCFNIIYTRTIQSILKKPELRKLISDYALLKTKSKKHNVTVQLK